MQTPQTTAKHSTVKQFNNQIEQLKLKIENQISTFSEGKRFYAQK